MSFLQNFICFRRNILCNVWPINQAYRFILTKPQTLNSVIILYHQISNQLNLFQKLICRKKYNQILITKNVDTSLTIEWMYLIHWLQKTWKPVHFLGVKTTKGDLQHLKPWCRFFVFKYGDTVSYISTTLQCFIIE